MRMLVILAACYYSSVIPPIEVPAIISILMLLSASALYTPQPNAPREPPPWRTNTFSCESSAVDAPDNDTVIRVHDIFVYLNSLESLTRNI